MPRGTKKTEVDLAREQLNKASLSIEVYERLGRNPDFQMFLENVVDKPIYTLLDLMETASNEQLPIIREQIRVLRSIRKHFESTTNRKTEIKNRLEELPTEE